MAEDVGICGEEWAEVWFFAGLMPCCMPCQYLISHKKKLKGIVVRIVEQKEVSNVVGRLSLAGTGNLKSTMTSPVKSKIHLLRVVQEFGDWLTLMDLSLSRLVPNSHETQEETPPCPFRLQIRSQDTASMRNSMLELLG